MEPKPETQQHPITFTDKHGRTITLTDQVGRMTTDERGHGHAVVIIDGVRRPGCGAGSVKIGAVIKKIIASTEVPLDQRVDVKRICRHRGCRTAFRAAMLAFRAALRLLATNPARRAREDELTMLAERYESPIEREQRIADVATLRVGHAAARADRQAELIAAYRSPDATTDGRVSALF